MTISDHRRKLKAGWPVYLFVAGCAAAYSISRLCVSSPTDHVRFSGMLLQLFGLGSVAWGLRQLRRRFRVPTLAKELSDVLRALPSIGVSGDLVGGGAVVTGQISARDQSKPEDTLEERLKVIERNFNRFEESTSKSLQVIREEQAELRESIKKEAKQREDSTNQIHATLKEVAVGGLRLEHVGLWWLFLGVLGTSIPDMIARFPSLLG